MLFVNNLLLLENLHRFQLFWFSTDISAVILCTTRWCLRLHLHTTYHSLRTTVIVLDFSIIQELSTIEHFVPLLIICIEKYPLLKRVTIYPL